MSGVDIDKPELYNFYHTARTALAGREDTPYQRKLIAARWYHQKHPDVSEKQAYLAFERD